MASNSSSQKSNRGFGANSDSGRNYASGAWGGGDLDAAALASKYNLDTSQEGRGEGHIWGRNADGSEVYIGKSSMDLASNEELIRNHSKQAGNEVDHSSVPESLSSSGDIKGAILTEWNGGPAAEEAPKEAAEPILESDQVKQARERVKNYESNILNGTTSNAIYGNAKFDPNKLNLSNSDSGYLDKYQFNPGGVNDDKPIEANYQPDTFSGSDVSAYETEAPPKQAANAFLQSQKNKAIKEYNIQPVGL